MWSRAGSAGPDLMPKPGRCSGTLRKKAVSDQDLRGSMRRLDDSQDGRKRAVVAAVLPASPQVDAHQHYSRSVKTTERYETVPE